VAEVPTTADQYSGGRLVYKAATLLTTDDPPVELHTEIGASGHVDLMGLLPQALEVIQVDGATDEDVIFTPQASYDDALDDASWQNMFYLAGGSQSADALTVAQDARSVIFFPQNFVRYMRVNVTTANPEGTRFILHAANPLGF
jgi:hypothetical protein